MSKGVNTKNPLKRCKRCGVQYAHVKGYTEEGEVCGRCLAQNGREKKNE